MSLYDIGNFTNSTSYIDMLQVVNGYTAGLFTTLILLGFFVVMMIVMSERGRPTKEGTTVSAWATAVVGMLYLPLGLVNGWVVLTIVLGFTVGLLFMIRWN